MAADSKHPDFDSLFRYRERDLPDDDWRAVEGHVQTCARCQGILDALAATGATADLRVPPLSEFMVKLATVQSEFGKEGAQQALRRRVESELAPYVGAPAANRILQQVTPSGENLLSTIDSVLRLFLGRAATDRLVTRIVDRAIMRL